MNKQPAVYILASRRNGTLYIGLTFPHPRCSSGDTGIGKRGDEERQGKRDWERPLPSFEIVPMIAADVPSILEIEQESQPEPWSRELFLEELERPHAQMLVARTVQASPGRCPRNRFQSFTVIPAKAGIQESCAPVDSAFRRNDLFQTLSDHLLGYICFWEVADEIQILNIAVHKAYRRRGVGRTLLRQALIYGYNRKAQIAMLEVRSHNVAARKLYESLGFKVVGERPNYYGLREAAIIMELELQCAKQ